MKTNALQTTNEALYMGLAHGQEITALCPWLLREMPTKCIFV